MDSQRPRPTIIECMLEVAKIFSQRSTCARLHVGSVITNEDMTQIVGYGYNGGAKGLSNDCESLEPGACGHIHSECNALIKADYSVKNKKMFLTHSPCKQCAKLIINAGVVEVYFEEKYRDSIPLSLLKAAGVKVFHFKDSGLEEVLDA